MELRDYQKLGKELIIESIRQGKKRPVLAAMTAYGKTIQAADILKGVQDKGNKGWFFCDRIQLVKQTIDKFREFNIDFGVRQADHELFNPNAPIQIASVQTVQSMVNRHKVPLPDFDLAIVDECHQQYEIVKEIITRYNNIPIIGLTATPYSKGLGKYYNNLIVPITAKELIENGHLCPVRYFGGEHIDLSGVKSSDPNTYSKKDLDRETEKDSERLVGCIIRNWLQYGENSQTIAFSPTQNHSKALVDRFNKNGISAEHIDCYTPEDERLELMEAHDAGEFKILSCSRLLNTGYDAPSAKCIIDCFPTKSETVYVQRVGRIMRTHDSKDYAIYLDHADNFSRFGYAEDIVPAELCDGTKTRKESELTKKKEAKEAKVRECPQCYQKMQGVKCRSCGYEVPVKEQMEDDGQMLKELDEANAKAANKTYTKDRKQQFLSEALGYAQSKGFKEGFASWKYKEKFGVFPRGLKKTPIPPTSEFLGFIHHLNIKNANKRLAG